MEFRKLGRSGLKVSAIGLGSWLTYGNTTEKESAIKTIEQAYESQINFFDTANVYALGEAERIMGETLRKYPRESYVLATKSFFPMGEGVNDRGLSRKHVFEQVHTSLKRLNVDYIDLYYCHRFDPETPVEETLRTIDDLVRQGKVLYVGVSQWSAAQIQEALQVADRYLLDRIVVNQPVYNMFNRYIEDEIIPVCGKNGIGQVVYSPLAQGVLTGKYKRGMEWPAGSRATHDASKRFMSNWLQDHVLEKTERLTSIADDLGVSLSHLALAWILRQPNISSALVGASKPEQIIENVKAVHLKLSEDVLQQIEDVLRTS